MKIEGATTDELEQKYVRLSRDMWQIGDTHGHKHPKWEETVDRMAMVEDELRRRYDSPDEQMDALVALV